MQGLKCLAVVVVNMMILIFQKLVSHVILKLLVKVIMQLQILMNVKTKMVCTHLQKMVKQLRSLEHQAQGA